MVCAVEGSWAIFARRCVTSPYGRDGEIRLVSLMPLEFNLRAPVIKSAMGRWMAGLILIGAARLAATAAEPATLAMLSPVAETTTSVGAAWRLAEDFAAAHEHCDVVVGRGDSMLPLYRDRTILVVQSVPMSELRPGMTVVFFGDTGRPVAHVLQEKTGLGWRAMGVGNREPDRTRVKRSNLVGVVIRAYATGPRPALLAAQ